MSLSSTTVPASVIDSPLVTLTPPLDDYHHMTTEEDASSPSTATSTVEDESLQRSRAFWNEYFEKEEEKVRAAAASTIVAASPSASPITVNDTSSASPSSPPTTTSSRVEWIASFSELSSSHIFSSSFYTLSPSHRILIIGCGSSDLGEKLYDELGCRSIDSIDLSPSVIEMQRQRNAHLRPEMRWFIGSCTDMLTATPTPIETGQYDLVLDKGTCDTLQFRCVSSKSYILVRDMLREVHRALTPSGTYICITPRKRIPMFVSKQLLWKVERMRVILEGEEFRRMKKIHIKVQEDAAAAATTAASASSASVAANHSAAASPATHPVSSPNHDADNIDEDDDASSVASSLPSSKAPYNDGAWKANLVWAHVCVKQPPVVKVATSNSSSSATDTDATSASYTHNIPKVVVDAQLLLSRTTEFVVRQEVWKKRILAAASNSKNIYNEEVLDQKRLLQVLKESLTSSESSTHVAASSGTSSPPPPLTTSDSLFPSSPFVTFKGEIIFKRTMSPTLVVYHIRVTDGDEVAAASISASTDASSSPSAVSIPGKVDMMKLEVLAMYDGYESIVDDEVDSVEDSEKKNDTDSSAASVSSVSLTSDTSVAAAASASPSFTSYTLLHSILRKYDTILLRGQFGCNQSSRYVIFAKQLALLKSSEQRMAMLRKKAECMERK